MAPMTDKTREQIVDAYRRMALEAHYRPAAPSDGFGNLTIPVDELEAGVEGQEYAERWWTEEDSGDFHIGSAHGEYRPAIVWAIEAARLMCGGVGSERHAVALLKMAADHMRQFTDRS